MGIKDALIDSYIKRQINKKENLAMVRKIVAVWDFLEGHKSTFFALLAGVAIVGNIFGFLSNDQTKEILALTGTGFAGSFALKVNRLIEAVKEAKQVVADNSTSNISTESVSVNSKTTNVAVETINVPEAK